MEHASSRESKRALCLIVIGGRRGHAGLIKGNVDDVGEEHKFTKFTPVQNVQFIKQQERGELFILKPLLWHKVS